MLPRIPRRASRLATALLLALLHAHAPHRALAEADPARALSTAGGEAEAREAVERATARFEAGDYASAALEFERAYRLLPAGPRRHAVLNNLAVCRQRLLQHAEALALYERYLEEAHPLPEDRAQVAAIVRGLRDLIGTLTIDSNVPADVWLDEQPRGRTPLRVALSAGEHVLEVRAEGYETERTAITVAARRTTSLNLTLSPEDVYRGAPRQYFWSGVALTSSTLVTSAALGARAVGLHREGERAGDTATTADEAKIRRFQLATDVTLAAAALFGVATLVLAFVTDFENHPSEPHALEVQVGPGQHGAALWLRGQF